MSAAVIVAPKALIPNAQAKTVMAEAKALEKSGQIAEARAKYAESQAMIEMKDAAEAIKRLAQLRQFSPEMAQRVSLVLHKRLESLGEQSLYHKAHLIFSRVAFGASFDGIAVSGNPIR